jgi:hypothetical protein
LPDSSSSRLFRTSFRLEGGVLEIGSY